MNNSSIICVDANVVVRLVAVSYDEAVRTKWHEWREQQVEFVAPSLLLYEVTNTLYQYRKHEELSGHAIQKAHVAALALPIVLYGDASLHRRAFDMAGRFDLPATYDAHYLAVAQRLGAQFWTADGRLARTVQDTLDWVHLIQ